jgi:hypothetical protein
MKGAFQMKFSICVISTLVLPVLAFGQQTITITGKVYNQSSTPVPNAVAKITGTTIVDTTGSDGSFILTGPAARLDTHYISHRGSPRPRDHVASQRRKGWE